MENVRAVIVRNDVDLSEIESLLRYLAIGFSLASSFQVVKSQQGSRISKSEADRLRSEFSVMFNGRPKSYLRRRIPLLLIGLTQFGVGKAQGLALNQRVQGFKDLVRKYDAQEFPIGEQRQILEMAEALSKPYYATQLNASLDPISSFFEGIKPNSYSNAVSEFKSSIEIPTVVRLEDDEEDEPERTIRIVEGDEVEKEPRPEIKVLQPEFEIIESGDQKEEPKPPKTETKTRPASTRSNKGVLIGVGVVATLAVAVFLLRKKDPI